ncbi:GDSL-type esterase/lipase family protein [Psychrobacter sp. I-STPA6b]|uniref:GDSL-type esterase/lipase family protein n=1 Tax=Psychrobacter sp. I-STPA6b TaxID=2585718 RepID=UPI001D0CC9FA|nr:GDSL-type esterase/lipase family protein [Psychrobacter sp. I-STPA6b]
MTTRRQFLAYLGNTAIIATVASSLAIGISGCGSKPQGQHIAKGSNVVALGDSLTYGYGASTETAYPTVLAGLTGWQIKNEGVNGNTSADVLARLDGIIAQKPDLVLLGIGGNDVLRRVQPATTKANITQIVQRLKSANIPVVLIAQPHFSASALFGKASDNPVYQEVADSEDVPLLTSSDGGWSAILSDDSLKSDQIHANEAGYRQFAENLHKFLQQQGYVS